MHKGGFERVTDYAKAIEDCLAQLRDAGDIASESDLAAVGFKTVIAKDVTGCVRLDEQRARRRWRLTTASRPRTIRPTSPASACSRNACPACRSSAVRDRVLPVRARGDDALRRARAWHDIGVRRWGFHGASHKFIAERSAELLGREDVARRARQPLRGRRHTPVDGKPLRVISCHLGGSSSDHRHLNGVAIGTSLGMSPQSGLPQNNRVGDLDSDALPYVDAHARHLARRSANAS